MVDYLVMFALINLYISLVFSC